MRSATALVLVILIWALSLLSFAQRVERSTPAPWPAPADGVVALTGSDDRIAAAMALLEAGKARRMLISGVNQKVNRAQIRAVAPAPGPGLLGRRLYDCCVDLGFQAMDTLGNARETAGWVKAKRYRSLIVVTSDFHMPRAMLELKGAMPGVRLTPYPVRSPELSGGHWWRTEEGARLLTVEYCKYLAILAREALLSLGPKSQTPARSSWSSPAPAAS